MSITRILLSFIFLIFLSTYSFAQQQSAVAPAQTVADLNEQYSQQIRAIERQDDFSLRGVKWLPWTQAGKSVQDFVTKREPNYKSLIGNGNHIDITVNDIDHNNQPDIILYFWNHCGNQGCMYKIYYDRESKKPRDFFGWEFVPYKKGVMLDHAYFSL